MFLEDRFIYFPTREIHQRPTDYGIEYEDVYFEAEDGVRLHGWYVPCPGSKSVLLFFHGNAGNISDRTDNIMRLNMQVGVDVFIIDYHGYGRSQGAPNEKNLCMDGRAAIVHLRERLSDKGQDKKLVIFGRSLGGAVAVDVAASHPCDGLIIESTFTSVPDIANVLFPIVPAGRLLKTKFNSLKKIAGIAAPLLVVHGERDALIPFDQGRRLFEAAPGPKEFYPIAGADHNDTYVVAGPPYFKKLAGFIKTIEGA